MSLFSSKANDKLKAMAKVIGAVPILAGEL